MQRPLDTHWVVLQQQLGMQHSAQSLLKLQCQLNYSKLYKKWAKLWSTTAHYINMAENYMGPITWDFTTKQPQLCNLLRPMLYCGFFLMLGNGKLIKWWIDSFREGRSCWWMYVGTVKICVAACLTLGGASTHFFPRESHSPSTKQLNVAMLRRLSGQEIFFVNTEENCI